MSKQKNFMKLFSYWRSSCSYRVRIALNLKNLDYQIIPIDLVKDGGEQFSAEFKKLNPQKLVPCLVDNEIVISQSLAILQYLDEAYPKTVSLVGTDIVGRAKSRALALLIATDIQPLDNLRVLRYLTSELSISTENKDKWYAHWIYEGFSAYESMLESTDVYSCGNTITIADICLIPQVYNAKRFNIDLSSFPNISKVNENCLALKAFKNASPENQKKTDS